MKEQINLNSDKRYNVHFLNTKNNKREVLIKIIANDVKDASKKARDVTGYLDEKIYQIENVGLMPQ